MTLKYRSAPGVDGRTSNGLSHDPACSVMLAIVVASLYSPLLIAKFIGPNAGTIIVVVISVLFFTVLHAVSAPKATRFVPAVTLSLAIVVASPLYLVAGNSPSATRYFLLYPLAFVLGVIIGVSGLRNAFTWIYVWVSFAVAVMAIIERLGRFSVVDRMDLAHGFSAGRTYRAFVATNHPLVLAAMLSAALAICLFAQSGTQGARHRYAISAVLVLGVVATNGRFSIGVCVALVLLFFIRNRITSGRGFRHLVSLLSTVALGAILYLSWQVWTNVQWVSSNTDGSASYRPAIYSLLPDILAVRPLGYGIDGTPAGVWEVYINGFAWDVSATVDSELVFLALQFGVLGILAYLLVWAAACGVGLRSSPEMGMGLVALLISGLSVALTAWQSVGSLVFLLLGIVVSVSRPFVEPNSRRLSFSGTTSHLQMGFRK